tara:strand:+ start:1112 stop:2713 length:1602 start_codon:yes stop_codon:yes gene_type:complete
MISGGFRIFLVLNLFFIGKLFADEFKPIEEYLSPGNKTEFISKDKNIYHKSLEIEPYRDLQKNKQDWSKPSRNLIEKIRNNFLLDFEINDRVKSEINFIVRNDDYMEKVILRSAPFLPFIVGELKARDMPLELVLLPIVESAYDPFAYSYGQAAGLWQLIPITAKRFDVDQNWWFDGRRDVIISTDAALDYLQYLHSFMNEDWLLALASYNAGEGTLSKSIKKNKKQAKPTDFWSLDLSSQTSAYVPRLLALVEIITNPKRYSIKLPYISSDPFFETVDIKSQLDLSIAAELAEIELNDLYNLNAGFNRWATSPDGPHRLLLPTDKAESFRDALMTLPEHQRVRWERHNVKFGETLSEIALKYNTTSDQIKLANDITSNMIRVDSYLMIPVSNQAREKYQKSESQRRIIKQNKTRDGNKIEHIVKRGESLWLLSRRYDVDINTIASWNGISPKDLLSIGEKIVIWTNKVSNKPQSVTRKIIYTVKNGDSLYLIAKKFRVTIVDIARWNNLEQDKILKPGVKLTLNIDVRNQSS